MVGHWRTIGTTRKLATIVVAVLALWLLAYLLAAALSSTGAAHGVG